MGHEVIVYGVIVGASYYGGDSYRLLQERNELVLAQFTPLEDDEWPWLNQSNFALPGQFPQGTYRRQIIHFGLSFKDDPSDLEAKVYWGKWFGKFEMLLQQLYWSQATVHIETDFFLKETIIYTPTTEALNLLLLDSPQPIQTWKRSTSLFDT